MVMRQPGGRCRRGRGEVDADAARVQQVHHLVEPAEGELARLGLERRPGEDAERHQVDPGFPHQGDVLRPDGAVPLLGVVVTAERVSADARPQRG
jgi:hypothetical protein